MDAARVVVVIVHAFLPGAEGPVAEEHEHQHIRLLDHIRAEDPVVRPMRVERELRGGDRIHFDVREVEVAVMLLVEACHRIIRNDHARGDITPGGQLPLRASQGAQNLLPRVGTRPLHFVQDFQGGFKGDGVTDLDGLHGISFRVGHR